jgi:hypothetical protein
MPDDSDLIRCPKCHFVDSIAINISDPGTWGARQGPSRFPGDHDKRLEADSSTERGPAFMLSAMAPGKGAAPPPYPSGKKRPTME